ncbi:MAG: hypothetical protein ACYCO3_07850 [Mycobacteriales bacterium]
MTWRLLPAAALGALTLSAAGQLATAALHDGHHHPMARTPASSCTQAAPAAQRAALDAVRDIATGNLASATRVISPPLRHELADATRQRRGPIRLGELTVAGSLSCPPAFTAVDVLAALRSPGRARPVAVTWTLRLTDTAGGWQVSGVGP